MTPPPPEGHPRKLAYTFVICILAPKFQHSLHVVTPGVYLCGGKDAKFMTVYLIMKPNLANAYIHPVFTQQILS